MINIEPKGGLANRMKALDSAIRLSRLINAPLRLIWVKDSDLYCSFQDLLLVPPEISIQEQRDLNIPSHRVHLTVAHYYYKYFQRFFIGDQIRHYFKDNDNVNKIRKHGSIYICTYNDFLPGDSSYEEFIPNESLARIINSITMEFNQRTIGVHVRSTDNALSKEHSPVNEFIKVMDGETARQRDVNFFVATDSPEIETTFRNRFPDRVICYAKRSHNRSEPAAIQDALIDLMCLSKTTKIIGSYWSTFSILAAEMGRIDLNIVDKYQN